jgi:ABC-type bacteriocin/lantibiotic exporter with double-glycine peptidase domain
VRQSSRNDCGPACLAMILNFSGRKDDVPEFRSNAFINEEGASLLDLRNFAANLNVPCRCVEMELSFLKELKSACVLHMINDNGDDHFQVCYGSIKKGKEVFYLMADPATYVYYLSDSDLERLWVSKAALYFDNLKEDLSGFNKPYWLFLLSADFLPGVIWLIIPILSVSSAFFGVAISWFLQRGLNNPMLFKKGTIAIAIIILLLVISLFKSVFSFLRHFIIMNINLTVNKTLMDGYFIRMDSVSDGNKKGVGFSLPVSRNSVTEMQKIQSAVSVFVGTFLSDGALLVLMLSAIFYEFPLAGLINLLYLVIAGYLNIRNLPDLSYNNARIMESLASTETYFNNRSHNEAIKPNIYNLDNLTSGHKRYIRLTRLFGLKIGRMSLFYECLGTINVIVVLALSINKVQGDMIDYSSFMVIIILSYFLTALVPKITNGLWVFSEGINACIQYRSNTSTTRSA